MNYTAHIYDRLGTGLLYVCLLLSLSLESLLPYMHMFTLAYISIPQSEWLHSLSGANPDQVKPMTFKLILVRRFALLG